MVARDPRAGVAGRDPARRIRWIHPDVVTVAAAAAGDRKGQAAIEGAMKAAVGDQYLEIILRIDGDADVISGAADQRTIAADELPRRAAVVRAPERTLIRSLDQRVDPLGIRRRDGDIDLAHWGLRQPRVGDARPGRSGVTRDIHAAAGPTAEHRPGVHHDFPRAGEEHLGIGRIDGHSGTAGVRVDEEHALPRRATVSRAENAALLLRPGRSA